MSLIQRCFLAGLVVLALASTAQAACRADGKVLFQDSFDELESSWGTFPNYAAEGGKFVFRPPAGFNNSSINSASIYEDVSVCVEVATPKPVKQNCGGIIFWALNYEEYYTFQVSSGDGTASVWHRQKGKWIAQFSPKAFAPVRRGPRANDLQLEISGNTVTFYVNGQQFRQFTGKAPQGGSQVGVIACSPLKSSTTVQFDNFTVWEPGSEGATADSGSAGDAGGGVSGSCSAQGKKLFEDQFDELGSSWGNSDDYEVDNGKFVIHPPAGYNTTSLNKASLYDDVDVCVEFTVPVATSGNCGAIVFWGDDYENFYSAQVDTGGQVAVWRRQKGKSLSQVPWQRFSAVNTRANAVNALRVVTAGNKAKFFVNGQLVKEFTGQPPQGGWQIGLQACSPSDKVANMQFDNFIVSAPGGT